MIFLILHLQTRFWYLDHIVLSVVLANNCHLSDGTLELLYRDNPANLLITGHMDLDAKMMSIASAVHKKRRKQNSHRQEVIVGVGVPCVVEKGGGAVQYWLKLDALFQETPKVLLRCQSQQFVWSYEIDNRF